MRDVVVSTVGLPLVCNNSENSVFLFRVRLPQAFPSLLRGWLGVSLTVACSVGISAWRFCDVWNFCWDIKFNIMIRCDFCLKFLVKIVVPIQVGIEVLSLLIFYPKKGLTFLVALDL